MLNVLYILEALRHNNIAGLLRLLRLLVEMLLVEVLNVLLFLEALRLNNMPGFQRLILADFAVRKNG